MSSLTFEHVSESLSSVVLVPGLPPELINEILCITALKSSRFERACLLSLSKGIYDIVSSIVYRVLAPRESDMDYGGRTSTSIGDFENFVSWVDSKSSSFLSRTVKALHLNLRGPGPGFKANDWTRLLNSLKGVQILHVHCYFWSNDNQEADTCCLAVWDAILHLSELQTLFLPWSSDGVDFSINGDLEPHFPALKSITHLIISCVLPTNELLHFVCLTHLAVLYPGEGYRIEQEDILKYEEELQPHLQVLVLVWDYDIGLIPPSWAFSEMGESKIVTLVVENMPMKEEHEYWDLPIWLRDDIFAGTDGGTTMWTRAEDILAKRRT